jgi:hypothetical protein
VTRAVFTSVDGGAALPATILDLIARAGACAAEGLKVDLQVMCFAFTDRQIAAALVALCRAHPALTLRIVADWSQSAKGRADRAGRHGRRGPAQPLRQVQA